MSRYHARRGTRCGDVIPFHCGDRVCDEQDPRHEGRLDAVVQGAFASVTWVETGWRTVGIPVGRLRRVEP